MKDDFQQTQSQPFPQLPAEACSELGYVNETRRRSSWVLRWLQATRSWFSCGRNA